MVTGAAWRNRPPRGPRYRPQVLDRVSGWGRIRATQGRRRCVRSCLVQRRSNQTFETCRRFGSLPQVTDANRRQRGRVPAECGCRGQGRRGQGCRGQGCRGQGCRGQGCRGQGCRGQGCRGQGCRGQGCRGQGCRGQGCRGQGCRGQGCRGQRCGASLRGREYGFRADWSLPFYWNCPGRNPRFYRGVPQGPVQDRAGPSRSETDAIDGVLCTGPIADGPLHMGLSRPVSPTGEAPEVVGRLGNVPWHQSFARTTTAACCRRHAQSPGRARLGATPPGSAHQLPVTGIPKSRVRITFCRQAHIPADLRDPMPIQSLGSIKTHTGADHHVVSGVDSSASIH